MVTLDQRAARLNLAVAVGADVSIDVTVTENGSAYDSTGASAVVSIINLDGTPAAVPTMPATFAADVLTFGLTDADTGALGRGTYLYAVVVTKGAATAPWMAGTLVVSNPTEPAGRTRTSVALEVAGGSSIALTVTNGGTVTGGGGGGGGVTDHGALTGLADDDHTQYLNTARHSAITGNPHGTTAAQVGADAAGTAAAGDAAHVAASDPHIQYQRESEKAAANGYASLNASALVPIGQLPTGTGASQVALGNHSHLVPFALTAPSGPAYAHASGRVATSYGRTLDSLVYIPMPVLPGHSYTKVGIRVTAAAAAGGLVRIGRYTRSATPGQPGSLIADLGTAATTSPNTNVWFDYAFTPEDTMVWWGVVFQGNVTGLTVFSANNNSALQPQGLVSSSTGEIAGPWYRSGVPGALPDPAVFTGVGVGWGDQTIVLAY